jgi:23S rRNA (cytosine1962-C5)-methyltransferase
LGEAVATATLKRGEDKRIRSGHLWVFSNEIATLDGTVAPGDAVEVRDAAGHLLGTGYANPHSLIAIRLVSRGKVELSRDFLEKRIGDAVAMRERFWPGERVCRVVYGEADLIPGLVVDRYDDVVAIQVLTAGIERRTDDVVAAVVHLLGPAAVVLRNDSPMRSYEGLALGKRVVHGRIDGPVETVQDGNRFLVDVLDGQKTGFFLDQRENRRATAPLAAGVDALDCCSYTGAWSIYAARAGARSLTAIDSSAPALELARRHVELNGVTQDVSLLKGDAFHELVGLARGGRSFGFVVLDPPSFVRSRKRIREGLRAYRALNRLGLTLVQPGGHLVSCSCSHLVERDAFMHVLVDAAREANRRARIVEVRGQSRDHPVTLGLPETEYLTCVVLEVI